MKIKGVSIMMMIVLGMIGGDYNLSFVQSKKLNCQEKCELECAPLMPFATLYLLCVQGCTNKCNKGESTVAVPDCNSSCGLINSIDINTGIYFLKNHFLCDFLFIMRN